MNDQTSPTEVEKTFSRRSLLKTASAEVIAAATGAVISGVQGAHATGVDSNRKVLTVYYSRTGSTRSMAEYIHKQVGGDMLALELTTPYSADYHTATQQVRLEMLTGTRTPLRAISVDMGLYDTLVIGSPRWWGTLSVPVLNFVLQYDLSGKTILPFSTHGGGDRNKINDDLELLCPNAKVHTGLALTSSRASASQSEIANWLGHAGMMK